MADSESPPTSDSRGRGRGRGKSRGGLGKYLRARGCGHRGGGGRPAEFHKRLLLEGEGPDDEEAEEEAAERAAKYSRRQLGTNEDRYKEEEPELGSDGEPILEPEVDLSTFLEKQKISDDKPVLGLEPAIDEDEVDTSLAHISSIPNKSSIDRKGKVQEIKWDRELEELSRAKAAAEAQRDLKARFKAKSETLKAKPVFKSTRERQAEKYQVAPELPPAEGSVAKAKESKEAMEDYLDELLG